MDIVNGSDQVDRAISTGKLHALPHFHTRPINVVVFHGSDREYSFLGGFPAINIELRSMDIVNGSDQVDRAISTGKLHALPHFHTRPINVVVFHGSDREYSFLGGFPA